MEILAIILAYVVGLLVGWLFVADRPVPDDEADIDTIRLGQAKALPADDGRWAEAAKRVDLPGEGSTGGATVTIEGANDGRGVWLRIGRPFDEHHRLHLLDPDAADHLGALLIQQAAHSRSGK